MNGPDVVFSGAPSGDVSAPARKRRYFTGTTTLATGQILCYQESPATASSTKGFGLDVELPSSANIRMVAGIVPAGESGKVGPCWVDLIQPIDGEVYQVLGPVMHSTVTAVSFAAGDPLIIDLNYPTYGSSAQSSSAYGTAGWGALVKNTLGLMTTATASISALSNIVSVNFLNLAIALEAATTTGTATTQATRTLYWVRWGNKG